MASNNSTSDSTNNNNNSNKKNNKLYSNINLITLDSHVILQPDSKEGLIDPKTIFIDRSNALKVEMKNKENTIINGPVKSIQKIFGCIGIINLLSGPHLMCITEKLEVGAIRGQKQVIHKAIKTILHPILKVPIPLSEDEKKEEKNYVSALTSMLETFDFYFSYDFDVTHSEQRVSEIENDPKKLSLPLWKRADKRFFWNYHLQQEFIKNEFHPFILPVMDGFISILNCEINTNQFKYIFISRRSCKRTGTRYHMRGADALGNVANFVETEQIVAFDQVLTSFVQTRGSIPLLWQQKGKGIKPKPVVDHSVQADIAFKTHINELTKLYGPQILISLIDQTGGESAIGNAFEAHSNLMFNKSELQYYAFDFHDRCKNNHYENLSELLDQVKHHLDSFGYLFKSTESAPSLLQTGSFRTNCIDCLDRTNVVQSVLARYILQSQMTRMGIISSSERIENHQSFEAQFKNVWADNADVMSEQYTGTGALKTDFTRTGKRSVKGTMADGMNSVRRYIHKNLKDDAKQLAIDMYLGRFVVERWISGLSSDYGERDVYYIQDHDATHGIPAVIKISKELSCISSCTKVGGRKKDYPFESIILLEKGKLNHSLLNIHYIDNPCPDAFLFATSLEREQFLQDIYKQKLPNCYIPANPIGSSSLRSPLSVSIDYSPELPSKDTTTTTTNDQEIATTESTSPIEGATPPVQPKDSRLKLLDMFDVFIGSWNMENITINSTMLAEWIPKDKDLYSLSAQRIASDRPSPGFVMNYKQYWFYLVRQYLGLDYVVVASSTTTNTASIVLIRKSLASNVNNIHVSYLQRRPSSKRSAPGALTATSSGSLSTSGSGQNSGANSPNFEAAHSEQPKKSSGIQSVTNFFKLGSKIVESTSNKPAEFFKEYKNKDIHYGTVISFHIRETSVCFANYCNNNSTGTMEPTVLDENNIIYIKNKQYLNGSHRYIFWSGDSDQTALSSRLDWNPIVDLKDEDEKPKGTGVIYYKALQDADPIAIQDEHQPLNEDSSCLFPPISSSIILPVIAPYSWLSTADLPCFIFIKSLVADQFELLPNGTKIDAFLEFNAYHLISDENSNSVRTPAVRSSLPVWSDTVELKSFIDDKEYLKTQYIQVALVAKEMLDYTLIGKGVIPLRNACGDGPTHFKINLCYEDELACQLQGEIQIYSKLEIARIVEQQATISPPPPIPVRNHPNHLAAQQQQQQQSVPQQPHRPAPSPPTHSPSNKSPILSYIPYFAPKTIQPSDQPQQQSTSSSPELTSTAMTQSPTSLMINPLTNDSTSPTQVEQQPSTPNRFFGGLSKVVDNLKDIRVSGEFSIFKQFSSKETDDNVSTTTSVSLNSSTSSTTNLNNGLMSQSDFADDSSVSTNQITNDDVSVVDGDNDIQFKDEQYII